MIVKDLQPFSIVEDAVFQGLMKHIVPQYNITSRRYFVDNAIGELYHDTRAKLVNSISSVKQLSLTSDIWSSRINDGYMVSQRSTLTSIRTKTADQGVKSMKRDMLASLEKRYENLYTCPHYVICTLLGARFKEVFFTDKESAHEILEEAYTIYAPVTESKSPPQKRLQSDTTLEHGIWDYIATKSGVKKPDTSVDAPTEISAYLRKKPMSKDTDRSFDVLERTCGYLFQYWHK